MGDNGQQLPTIQVIWDPDKQAVACQFKPEEFKAWPFVIAVLEMAKEAAKAQWQAMQMQALQAQAAQVQQMQRVAKLLEKG